MMVDFKLQLSLHKEPPEAGLVKKLTGSLYWWVEQCVPTLHREVLPHSLIYSYMDTLFSVHFALLTLHVRGNNKSITVSVSMAQSRSFSNCGFS